MLALTGKFNFITSEETTKWFTDTRVNISLPSFDLTRQDNLIMVLIAVFIGIMIIGVLYKMGRDY